MSNRFLVINSKAYWDFRFQSGDWDKKQGRLQTYEFTKKQLKYFPLSSSFSGTILDFGCGLGDSFPLYKKKYPKATLRGFDISTQAIKICKQRFGSIASFDSGEVIDIQKVDVIIASNIFEHLDSYQDISRVLYNKCNILIIVVPYKETIKDKTEHIHSFNRSSFDFLGVPKINIYPQKEFSEFGINLFFNIYIKNAVKMIIGRNLRKRNLQIMYTFSKNIV
jgi:cyclopropane fatty-acyl-phospholipid synthase-like methyltransferase